MIPPLEQLSDALLKCYNIEISSGKDGFIVDAVNSMAGCH